MEGRGRKEEGKKGGRGGQARPKEWGREKKEERKGRGEKRKRREGQGRKEGYKESKRKERALLLQSLKCIQYMYINIDV